MRMADFGTGLIIGQLECSLARASKLTCTHLLCFNLGPSLCSSFFDYCNCPHCLLFRDILKFHILPPSQSMSLRQWSKFSSAAGKFEVCPWPQFGSLSVFEAMVKVKQLARSRFVLGLSLDFFQPAGFTRLPG